jgi:hypothetical protein
MQRGRHGQRRECESGRVQSRLLGGLVLAASDGSHSVDLLDVNVVLAGVSAAVATCVGTQEIKGWLRKSAR